MAAKQSPSRRCSRAQSTWSKASTQTRRWGSAVNGGRGEGGAAGGRDGPKGTGGAGGAEGVATGKGGNGGGSGSMEGCGLSARGREERDREVRRDRCCGRGTMVARCGRPKYTGPATGAPEAEAARDLVRDEMSGPAGRKAGRGGEGAEPETLVRAGVAALSTAKTCGEKPVSRPGACVILGPCRRKSPKSEAASGDARNVREESGRSSPPKPTFGVEEAR